MDKIQTTILSTMRICDSVITNAEGVKFPTVRGPVSAADVISEKGYRYRRGFWENVLARDYVKDSINSRKMLGMIEHPISDEEYLSTPYETASHLVIATEIVDSVPYGTFALLNNSHGNAIKALADLYVPIGVSTRGLGDMIQDSVSPYVDETNYGLITWDFTRNPNFKTLAMQKVTDSLRSNPQYQELIQAYGLRDSAEEHYSKERLIKDISKMLGELSNLIGKL